MKQPSPTRNSKPLKPGPQPWNQLAGTLEENLERIHKYIPVEAKRIIRMTPRAVLIDFRGHETWIPKSQLRASDYFKQGDEWIVLDVVRAFAVKEGLW